MYTVAIKQDFITQHYLIGGDWGDENRPHSHHYEVEVALEGNSLDEHSYLLDISCLETELSRVISQFRDRLLNEMAEFEGLNPSIEQLARIIHGMLSVAILKERSLKMTVKVWEKIGVWASYCEGD